MIRPVLLSALLALPAAAADAPVPETVVPRPVVSTIVNPETGLPVTYVGTVAARTEADLGFPLSGTVAERPVSAGYTVAKAGAVPALSGPRAPRCLRGQVRARN